VIPILLLHALGTTSGMWAAQRVALRRAGHHVLTFDQGVHGEGTPTLASLVDDLTRMLDSEQVDDVVLAGSSMGGYVAMAHQCRHPGRVRALALLGTRADADSPQVAAGREAFARMVLDPVARPALVASLKPKLVGATTRAGRPEVLAELSSMVDSVDPRSLAWAQRAIAVRPDFCDAMRAADVPSVVVMGDEDELVSLPEARRLAEALPRSELVVLPGAGHLTPMESPDAVTAALVGLLRRVGAGSGAR
jgi:pimeloyl-ACP methyl ester carboxylesterase